MVIKKLNNAKQIKGKTATHFHVKEFKEAEGFYGGSYGAYEENENKELEFVAYTQNSFVTDKTKDFPDLTQEEIEELNENKEDEE